MAWAREKAWRSQDAVGKYHHQKTGHAGDGKTGQGRGAKAHIDMVPQANTDTQRLHDQSHRAYIDGEWVTARVVPPWGADNGM